MPSMRSVTRKPPITLSVPKINAMNAMMRTPQPASAGRLPSTISAPSTTMPWMALVPDISGVCSVLGTLEMTANPTNPANTRIAMFNNNWSYMASSPRV